MPTNFRAVILLATGGLLAACSQATEPEPVRAEPVFDKFGSVSICVAPDGTTFPPSTTAVPGQNPCDPPPDDCPGGYFSSTGAYICPDPGDDDPGRTPGRVPGAAAGP